MKISKIGYLIKEGIRGIFLHGFMSFAAVCVTVACLLIVGSITCVIHNVNIMVEDLNKTNEIRVYVDENLSDAEARSIGTLINKVDNVFKAIPVSREDAWKDFVADHGNAEAFEGINADVLRHRFEVTLKDNSLIEQTVEDLKKIEGVVNISASYELAEGFAALQNILRIVSVAVIAVLLPISLLIISNTVKLAMYDRREEIAIMKMVGATNGFIRLPYVVEGFILGMLGAAIAFGLEWLLYDLLLGQLASADTLGMLNFVPFEELLVPMMATFAAAGLFVGVVGSWSSIRKFMDV